MNDYDSYTTRLNPELNPTSENGSLCIELFYRGNEYLVTPDDLPFQIGRDVDTCNMVIGSELASRNHCALVVKEEQVGIEDTSRNGTVIKIGRAQNVVIREKFYPLTGQGYIKLGDQIKLEDPNLIMYKIHKIDKATLEKKLKKKR